VQKLVLGNHVYPYCPTCGKGHSVKEETSEYKGQVERTSRKNVMKAVT